jgi:hypothetical protein
VLDLLLVLSPIAAVVAVAVVVVRRERRPEPAPARGPLEDPVVDLTFLRSTPWEIDLRITQLANEGRRSLGARMRDAQEAGDAVRPPVAGTRRRRQRPLVAR